MLELYYSRYSINSEKVLLCLFEHEIPFSGHFIDLFAFDQTAPDYLAINPNGLVPTLVIDGEPLYESTAINEFIEDSYTERSLRPSDPLARGRMRVWVQHCQDVFYPAMALISQVRFIAAELKRRWSLEELDRLIKRKPNPDRVARQLRAVRGGLPPDEIVEAQRKADGMLDRMEAELGHDREWLAGSFSLADIAAAPNVHRFALLGLMEVVQKRPRVNDWYRRMLERPSFKRTYEYAPPNAGARQDS
jgi:glutathione S-transferase